MTLTMRSQLHNPPLQNSVLVLETFMSWTNAEKISAMPEIPDMAETLEML